MKNVLIGTLAGVLALAGSTSALAAGASPGTLDVKLTVTTGCDINGNGGIGAGTGANALIDFGSHAPSATVSEATTGSSLVITCSGTQTPSLAFDGGQNPVGAQRNLKQISGTGTIPYTLGSSTGAADYTKDTAVALSAFTAGQARTVNIYGNIVGAIPAGAEGAYTDAVQISLTW